MSSGPGPLANRGAPLAKGKVQKIRGPKLEKQPLYCSTPKYVLLIQSWPASGGATHSALAT